MDTLPRWLQLSSSKIASIVAQKVSNVVIYLNGTRRWYLSTHQGWSDYVKTTGVAHRSLSQLFYSHGIRTLIQPVLGYDLVSRGQNYLKLAIEQGLAEMTNPAYRDWYRQADIQVTFYGNWADALPELGFGQTAEQLYNLMEETRQHETHKLLLGAFADEGLERIVKLAKSVTGSEELLKHYYGHEIGPIDLIIGSGQPAIWDLPLLDINKASMYFLQAPTFCLNKETLRRIFYDHLYERVNDDELYQDLPVQAWQKFNVLGLGQHTQKGWIAT